VCKYGMNNQVGLLINSSREILYASKEADFAEAALKKATELQIQMAKVIEAMSS
jgi:orotidine-5'-phosphate decarboxylase